MTQSVSESTDPTTTLSEVRSWWEVPCIAHFCHTFSEALEFPLFEIEEFESALLPSVSNGTTGCEQVHPLIVDIHIAFLKGILEKKEIGVDNWELLLKLHFVWRCEFLNEKYNPMEHLAYSQIHTRTKVEILHRLCHWRLELDDVTDCLKCVDPQEMRLEEVGTDRRGNRYWYFYGMRLYQESKEAQQYNKRYKTSSSLRSHREVGTPSSSSGSKKQQHTPRTPSTAKSRVKKTVLPKGAPLTGDTSDVDSCTSGEDSSRVDGSKRVTRSSRQKALPNETHSSQDTSRQTDSSSPVTEGSAPPPRTREQTPAVGENEFSSRTGWSVVCDSLKDWRELVSSLEESPHSCEVELCDCVRDELLPSLSQIDADRTLIPLAPTVAMEGDTSRRTSERLHKKMKPSYPEQISFMGVPEDPRKSRQSPECAGVCEESEESDSFDSEVEEERKREMEREKRDQEWKEAYSGNIQGPRKKAASSLVTDLEEEMTEEELRIAMLKLVDELKKHTDCWPFIDPVTDAIAPGYHDVIKRPMDVLSVEKKLKNEEYSTKEQFAKDFRRIFKNCRRYNGADNEYTEMADTIRLHFNKLFVKFFSQPSTSGRRLRSPISPIGSSSDSEAEQGASLVLPRTPGVKKRRKRRTAENGERDNGVKISPSKRNKPGIRESKESGFANYPPFYPPYAPYPPYHQDKDSSSMYPPFPHEFPPFSYFPPFLSNPHPPYPSFPPYWGQRSHRHEDKHRCREVSSGGPGSTKERREEEAKLQNVIHSQGLLAKHKRDRVSSTTAEHSSLSSPESATPLNDASADPHRGAREEEGRKGSIESRASSSSSMGAAFPSHIPRPHYGHLPPRPYHGGYYPPHYRDYMMDPYLHPPPFYERPAQLFPPAPAPRHPASRTEQRETTEEQGPVPSKELTQVPVTGKVSEEGAASGEQREDKQTESNQEDPASTPNPSPDQFPALAESNISPTPAQTKTAGGSETVEEQPHSTTEEADTQMYSHPPPPPPPPSPTKRSKFSRPSPHPPYPYYPPSPYAPHGYSHPPYDPYFAADMMTWQQQHALQGMNSSKKRIARTPSMEHKYYKSPSDFSRGLPPYPGAPTSPEDFPSPYFYPSPSHLPKQRRHKPYCETDVLPPPTAYSLQESAPTEDPSNVPDYKESLADYALHLAGGSKTASGEEREASDLKPEPSPEEAAEVNSHPPAPLNEDPLPLSLPFTTPFLNGMQASTPEVGEEMVQDLNSNNNNNNNSNNNNNIVDFPNLEPHAFSLPYVPLSPTRSPPPSYSHFMQRRHASFRPNTFGSFFLPSGTSMPLLPPVHAAPSHRPDLKLELIKQKQAQLNEWVARVNSQSHGRYAHLKQAGPEVPAGHSQIDPFSPTVPNDRSEI